MNHSILTCSPHFVELAINELRREHPSIIVLATLSPGCLLIQTPVSFDQLTRPFKDRLPIYLHHLCPAHQIIPLRRKPHDLANLQQAVAKLTCKHQPLQIQVRVLPDMVNGADAIAAWSADEIYRAINYTNSHQSKPPVGKILSLVVARQATEWRAFLGVSWANQNISAWAGGVRPHRDMPNRAGYKLLEALADFKIGLRTGDHVLDLGASPGAWTMVLRHHGMKVTAVAPTEMYPALMEDPQVFYKPMTAEEYLAQNQDTFDLITNDMKMDAQDSSRMMVSYAEWLRPEGIAIMTLKLRQPNTRRLMDHSFRILRRAYKIIQVRQLVSNRQEVCLFLRRKT